MIIYILNQNNILAFFPNYFIPATLYFLNPFCSYAFPFINMVTLIPFIKADSVFLRVKYKYQEIIIYTNKNTKKTLVKKSN